MLARRPETVSQNACSESSPDNTPHSINQAADIVSQGIEETLECMRFPDGNSTLMLVAARLRYMAGTHWATRRYLNTGLLKDHPIKEEDS